MHRFSCFHSRWRYASALNQDPQVVQSDPAVDLNQGPFDELLQFGGVHLARSRQSEQFAPGVRREAPPLVRSQYSECHGYT